jgi:hypothetical protein
MAVAQGAIRRSIDVDFGLIFGIATDSRRYLGMPLGVMFMYGFLGAFAVDFQSFYEELNQRKPQVVRVPVRYTHASYWLLRLIHAVIGGGLAVTWGQTYPADPLVLVAVGGSARIIILKFGQFVVGRKEVE